MKLEVLQEDIRGYLYPPTRTCPLARALQRQTGDPEARVGMSFARANGKMYYLSYEAKLFVRAHDEGQEVKPTSFELQYSGKY